jgi:hypothetical protein
VQHRYLQWIGSRRSGLRWLTALIQKLWDIAWDTWDHRNRVLHDTELSVARDIEIQQITEQFHLGRSGLPNEVKALFRGGLTRLLQQQPAYQTAWLIRVQAARARNERRNDQQLETSSPCACLALFAPRGDIPLTRCSYQRPHRLHRT